MQSKWLRLRLSGSDIDDVCSLGRSNRLLCRSASFSWDLAPRSPLVQGNARHTRSQECRGPVAVMKGSARQLISRARCQRIAASRSIRALVRVRICRARRTIILMIDDDGRLVRGSQVAGGLRCRMPRPLWCVSYGVVCESAGRYSFLEFRHPTCSPPERPSERGVDISIVVVSYHQRIHCNNHSLRDRIKLRQT